MNKLKLMTVIMGLTTSGVFFVQNAHAEVKETEASVVVKGGELSLKSVDNINFTDVKINGKDQDVIEKDNENTPKAKLNIEDLRASESKGWSLKAKLKEGNFHGMGLKLAPTITANGQAAETVKETQNLNTDEQLVASVSDDKVKDSEFDTEMMLNAKLNIPSKTRANSYSTTIVWNLTTSVETK